MVQELQLQEKGREREGGENPWEAEILKDKFKMDSEIKKKASRGRENKLQTKTKDGAYLLIQVSGFFHILIVIFQKNGKWI